MTVSNDGVWFAAVILAVVIVVTVVLAVVERRRDEWPGITERDAVCRCTGPRSLP